MYIHIYIFTFLYMCVCILHTNPAGMGNRLSATYMDINMIYQSHIHMYTYIITNLGMGNQRLHRVSTARMIHIDVYVLST